MIVLFVFSALVALVAVLFMIVGKALWPGMPAVLRFVACPIIVLFGLVGILASSAINVKSDKGGLVEVKIFAADLQNGAIIATNGEKGPQAAVLPPGWHFGYFPWKYSLTEVDNIIIPQGQIGVVTARDGKPLPEGEVFAPAWADPQQMIDGMVFLTTGNGYKGPQLTVLPPGQYRYNPRLFDIATRPALEVPVGSVAVIKANAGPFYEPSDGEELETVNGVTIVPNSYRGIWRQALQPNAYYLHPDAYVVRLVQTTKRVYSYTGTHKTAFVTDRPQEDNSVEVKTSDGFKFPVDVRVSVKISAEDAPYVVAMLADPDSDPNNDGFDLLEERAILPSIRSIFRNTAETKTALQYINSRSIIEEDATKQFHSDMQEFRIEVDRVYIADIGLDKTEQGRALLSTQTDKQLAVEQQSTYKEQTKAQEQRAIMVKAEEEANQEKHKAEAAAKVVIAESQAQEYENRARGEAAAYREKIDAFGGTDEYIRALAIEKLIEVLPQIRLPSTVVIGSGGDLNETLLTPVLTDMVKQQQLQKPAAK